MSKKKKNTDMVYEDYLNKPTLITIVLIIVAAFFVIWGLYSFIKMCQEPHFRITLDGEEVDDLLIFIEHGLYNEEYFKSSSCNNEGCYVIFDNLDLEVMETLDYVGYCVCVEKETEFQVNCNPENDVCLISSAFGEGKSRGDYGLSALNSYFNNYCYEHIIEKSGCMELSKSDMEVINPYNESERYYGEIGGMKVKYSYQISCGKCQKYRCQDKYQVEVWEQFK